MDYIVNDTELTATADAIREKTGDTELLEWITGKGFADAISGLSTGEPLAYGTVKPTADCTQITINHGLGIVPKYGVFFILNGGGNIRQSKAVVYTGGQRNTYISEYTYGDSYAYATTSSTALINDPSAGGTNAFRGLNAESFMMGNNNANVKFYSSYTYLWVVWGA